jgi:ketosteroid isomerase-like protein
VPEHGEIEVLRRGYETFEREGIEGIMPLLDPDIEWRNPADSPIAGVFHGHDGVRTWYAAATEAFEELGFIPDEMRPLGAGRVLVLLRLSFRGLGSEIDMEVPFAHIWRIRNGLATHLQMYSDPNEALEAGESAV